MKIPDRYEIRQSLASTPLERTFLGFDAVLRREVLLKLPGPGAAEWSMSVREALLREARALAKVKHVAISPVLHVEETLEGLLLVLEPPAGETLAERLQRGPLDVAEAIRLGVTISDALAAVHYAGIVHRAVGPQAIRLHADGRVELSAFSFAKAADNTQRSSLAHAARNQPEVSWLPDYSAPEQLAGLPAEPRSDVYALGCTLFRCLAGRDAFPTGAEHEPMPDLRRVVPGVGKELAELVRKCAAHAKTARYPNALAVKTALEKLAEAAPGSSRQAPLLAVAGITVAVVLAVAFWPRTTAGGDPTRGIDTAELRREDTRYGETYGDAYQHVYGLFIGIGQTYDGTRWPRLTNPVREVHAIADQLKANDPQWREAGAITILEDADATFDRIKGAMQAIAARATKEDGVLFYFSGHGTRDGESFGLCPQDTSGTVENGLNYLRRDVLLTWLKRDLLAKHALVVLDCCHSGAVFEKGLSRGELPPTRDAVAGGQHRARFAREFLCSSGANQSASDGAGMSPFCTRLLAELRVPATPERPFVAARFLANHIAEAMDAKGARTGRLQTPCFRDMAEQQGSFVFVLPKAQ